METGRLFVRNLAFVCSEDDLRSLFKKFGPLSEVHIPIDKETKKPKGYAYILYLMPEHAVIFAFARLFWLCAFLSHRSPMQLKAFLALDKSTFQGRLIHVIPAKSKKEIEETPEAQHLTFKQKRDKKKKENSTSEFNWNSLFMSVRDRVPSLGLFTHSSTLLFCRAML